MITEIHFMAGTLLLSGLLLTVFIGHSISGMAYPGAGAPFLPEGPVRKLVQANVAFLAACGILELMGI